MFSSQRVNTENKKLKRRGNKTIIKGQIERGIQGQ